MQRAHSSPDAARSPRLLFASNGHGEDAVAGRLVDRVRALARDAVEIEAWPMVGAGDAYAARGVQRIGTQNLLPSGGFATLSLPMLLRDLRAGWLGVHRKQWRDARSLRGRYDLVVAVGDVVPMLAATLTHTPFVLVGCAKSAYYGRGFGYTRLEKHLLRKHCVRCYPRDARTAHALARDRIASLFVGNPMMDDLEPTGLPPIVPNETFVVACLPGSRDDAEANAARILSLVAEQTTAWEHSGCGPGGPGGPGGPVAFVFAVAAGFDIERTWQSLSPAANVMWRRDVPSTGLTDTALGARLTNRASALFVKGRFADVILRARVAIGLAGTANEQAIGLGVPLVTFATNGVQGPAYLRMKMRYFGDAAMATMPTGKALFDAIQQLACDEQKRARMIAEGHERMGDPGASDSIARDILALLAGLGSDSAGGQTRRPNLTPMPSLTPMP